MSTWEEWAIRWPDGTLSGAIHSPDGGDYGEQMVRKLAPDQDQVVHRTVTVSSTDWEVAPRFVASGVNLDQGIAGPPR